MKIYSLSGSCFRQSAGSEHAPGGSSSFQEDRYAARYKIGIPGCAGNPLVAETEPVPESSGKGIRGNKSESGLIAHYSHRPRGRGEGFAESVNTLFYKVIGQGTVISGAYAADKTCKPRRKRIHEDSSSLRRAGDGRGELTPGLHGDPARPPQSPVPGDTRLHFCVTGIRHQCGHIEPVRRP